MSILEQNETSQAAATRLYSFLHIIDLNAKFNSTELNDLVQDLLDDQEYELKTEKQNELEEKDAIIREKQAIINQYEADQAPLQASISRLIQEGGEAKELVQRLQAERDEATNKVDSLTSDNNKLANETSLLEKELEQLKARQQEVKSPIQIGSSDKYQDRVARIEKEAEGKKNINWAEQAQIGLRRFSERYGDDLFGSSSSADPSKTDAATVNQNVEQPKEVPAEDKTFPKGEIQSGGYPMATGIPATDRAMDGEKEAGIPNEFQTKLNTANAQIKELMDWREQESSWRATLEKKLEQHGIIIS